MPRCHYCAVLAVIAANRAPHHINPRGRENLSPPCPRLYQDNLVEACSGPPQIERQASTFLDRCVVIATSWAAHYRDECGRVGLLPCPRSFLLFMPDWEAYRRTLGRASLFLDRVPVPTDYLNGKAGNRPTVVPVLHARGLSSWPRGVTTGSLDAKKSAMPCRGFLIRVILAGW